MNDQLRDQRGRFTRRPRDRTNGRFIALATAQQQAAQQQPVVPQAPQIAIAQNAQVEPVEDNQPVVPQALQIAIAQNAQVEPVEDNQPVVPQAPQIAIAQNVLAGPVEDNQPVVQDEPAAAQPYQAGPVEDNQPLLVVPIEPEVPVQPMDVDPQSGQQFEQLTTPALLILPQQKEHQTDHFESNYEDAGAGLILLPAVLSPQPEHVPEQADQQPVVKVEHADQQPVVKVEHADQQPVVKVEHADQKPVVKIEHAEGQPLAVQSQPIPVPPHKIEEEIVFDNDHLLAVDQQDYFFT
jgi:S-DNA-T family DNA segregation ATPase FtsK/SpoIIIE